MERTSNILADTLQVEKSGLLRFLRSRLGCADAADDVYQVLSERIYSTPPVATITQPRAYLFKAAANAASSHMRAAKSREHYEAAAAKQRDDIDSRDPERVILGQNALRVVENALSELPVLTRQMFVAFRIHGHTQKNIAKQYGVSLSTVEKRVAKAAAHCHRRMREAGVTATDNELRLIDGQSHRRGENQWKTL